MGTRCLLAAFALAATIPAQEPPPRVDFARQVRPVLMSRCARCHGERRHEADLRLDRRRYVFSGDPELWVITPGAPEDSLLIELVSLPIDDADHMPAEGQALTPGELGLLRRWIAEGADWPEPVDAEADAAAERRRAAEALDVPALDSAAMRAEQDALADLRARGVRAARIAATSTALEVDVTRVAAEFDDDALLALRALATRLCWLRLSGSRITDRGLTALRDFAALRRLDLSRTAITHVGLGPLAQLPALHALDLHGTHVDDRAIEMLGSFPALTHVNLWHTPVTDAGIARLRAARPELRVERGTAAERLREPPRNAGERGTDNSIRRAPVPEAKATSGSPTAGRESTPDPPTPEIRSELGPAVSQVAARRGTLELPASLASDR